MDFPTYAFKSTISSSFARSRGKDKLILQQTVMDLLESWFFFLRKVSGKSPAADRLISAPDKIQSFFVVV